MGLSRSETCAEAAAGLGGSGVRAGGQKNNNEALADLGSFGRDTTNFQQSSTKGLNMARLRAIWVTCTGHALISLEQKVPFKHESSHWVRIIPETSYWVWTPTPICRRCSLQIGHGNQTMAVVSNLCSTSFQFRWCSA